MQQTGKYILIAGLIIVLIGAVLWLFGNKLSWLGRLPGDLYVKKENYTLYIPITTMILLSIVITLIMWLIRKIQS